MSLSVLENTSNQCIIHRIYSNKVKIIGKYEGLELFIHQIIQN